MVALVPLQFLFSSSSVHGYFREDLQELSSISAAKLTFEAEEETNILVKSLRSDLNSSINHTLVQTHWNLHLGMHTSIIGISLSSRVTWVNLPLMDCTDVAAVLLHIINLWSKTSEGTYLDLLWANNPNKDCPLPLPVFRPLCFCVCGLADQLQCSVFLSGGRAEWHPGASGVGVRSH